MVMIGIEEREGLVYEGSHPYGRALWPTPVITPASIVFPSAGQLTPEKSNDPITQACRFREDYFDPVSRVRRGRFYSAQGSQPAVWYVQPHPAMPLESRVKDKHDLSKRLNTFHARPVWTQFFKDAGREQPLVLLGLDDRFTVWAIVNIEAISTGEDLVTLKARSSLGVLPQIDSDRVPESFRARVDEKLNQFADEVHRAAPASVIDRARDAASQILLAYFDADGRAAKDLSALAKDLESKEKAIAAAAAKIIARLHARAKPAEEARRPMRPVREQDAELATQCVGTILCELGWAEWP